MDSTDKLRKDLTNILMQYGSFSELLVIDLAIYVLQREKETIKEMQ